MREDAYLRVALQVDQGLAQGPPTSTAVLDALRAQRSIIVTAAVDALSASIPENPSQRDVVEPELVAALSVLQVACLYDAKTQTSACDEGVVQVPGLVETLW